MGLPSFRARKLWLGITAALALIIGLIPSYRGPTPAQRHIAAGNPLSAALHTDRGPAPLTPIARPECQSLHAVACRRRGETRDPTGSVRRDIQGEVRVLRQLEEIVREHPEWTQEEIYDELASRIYSPSRKRRAETAFAWVRRRIEKIISSRAVRSFTRAERAELIQRVRRVELDLPPPASRYHDEPDLITRNGVMFERLPSGKTRIRIGGAYLAAATSWFNLVFSMAHEFGHAIDPCELKETRGRALAYEKLGRCFVEKNIIPSGEEFSCGKRDQLAEAFADWIAVQVVREALEEFSREYDPHQLVQATINAIRDLCDQDDSIEEEGPGHHPTPETRIDRIFGADPGINQLLGCPAKPACAFETL